MKKLIGLVVVGFGIVVACNFLNVVNMNGQNMGKDLAGNDYYLEGYGKGDTVLIVENSYYEVLADIKIK